MCYLETLSCTSCEETWGLVQLSSGDFLKCANSDACGPLAISTVVSISHCGVNFFSRGDWEQPGAISWSEVPAELGHGSLSSFCNLIPSALNPSCTYEHFISLSPLSGIVHFPPFPGNKLHWTLWGQTKAILPLLLSYIMILSHVQFLPFAHANYCRAMTFNWEHFKRLPRKDSDILTRKLGSFHS